MDIFPYFTFNFIFSFNFIFNPTGHSLNEFFKTVTATAGFTWQDNYVELKHTHYFLEEVSNQY